MPVSGFALEGSLCRDDGDPDSGGGGYLDDGDPDGSGGGGYSGILKRTRRFLTKRRGWWCRL